MAPLALLMGAPRGHMHILLSYSTAPLCRHKAKVTCYRMLEAKEVGGSFEGGNHQGDPMMAQEGGVVPKK